jgi:lipocalin
MSLMQYFLTNVNDFLLTNYSCTLGMASSMPERTVRVRDDMLDDYRGEWTNIASTSVGYPL